MSTKNGKLEALIKSGEVIVHPRTASKAALKRAAKGQFKTFRLKKGIRIEKAAKKIH
jgi:hypothetical protein